MVLQVLAALACDLNVDAMPPVAESYRWSWFKKYCLAARVTSSLLNRQELPPAFIVEVSKKLLEMIPDDEEITEDYFSPDIFKQEHDEQVLQWLHRQPDTWTLSWGGTGTIYLSQLLQQLQFTLTFFFTQEQFTDGVIIIAAN